MLLLLITNTTITTTTTTTPPTTTANNNNTLFCRLFSINDGSICRNTYLDFYKSLFVGVLLICV